MEDGEMIVEYDEDDNIVAIIVEDERYVNSKRAVLRVAEILEGITLCEPEGWWHTTEEVTLGVGKLKEVLYYLLNGTKMPTAPKFSASGVGVRHEKS